MTSTYLISIGDDEMLGLGKGADPAAAVDDYYDTLDMYCAPSAEISERFSVSTLRLPDGADGVIDGLIDEYGADALPQIENIVMSGGLPAAWQVVDVVMEGGGRTAVLRG
jgi:hypothetical protein